MVKLIALYKKPDDVSAFDKHYAEVHTPIVKKLPGLRQLELSKITGSAIGETPNYLLCEMYFDSKDDARCGACVAGRQGCWKRPYGFRRKICDVDVRRCDFQGRNTIV